ncbi:MAG: cardiolipin synthase [Bacteroidales bacterium]|nr:cardiolipin synthase [Bacteroidales bacterium]
MIYEIALILVIIGSIVLVIMENRKPYISLFWVVMLAVLPGVGLVLYLLLGKDYRSRRVIKADELAQLDALRNQAVGTSITELPDGDKYAKLAAMMRNANDSPIFADNQVRIFTDFTPLFQAMLDDIAAAKNFVHIQFYIIEDDEVGRQLSSLLIRKAQQGVDVRLIFDSWANLFVRNSYYDHMRQGGVKVQSFQKLLPSMFTRDVNCRTHRKIVVVDGHTAYTGGMNIARRYRDGINHGNWRDTHIRIQGPAASQLELSFLADWRFCTKELLAQPRFFPPLPTDHPPLTTDHQPLTTDLVQIITSGPMDEWNTVMQGLVQAIAQSRRYLYLQTPYFIPTHPILLAIRNAALAGVDVRLMLPSTADRGAVMLYASQSYFRDLLPAGVKIYMYNKGYLHAKTMVCDDDFVTIGSTNIDPRSLEQNFEVNAFLYDHDLAIHQRDIFLDDLRDCTLVDPAEWEQRPAWHKFRQSFSRMLTPIL